MYFNYIILFWDVWSLEPFSSYLLKQWKSVTVKQYYF